VLARVWCPRKCRNNESKIKKIQKCIVHAKTGNENLLDFKGTKMFANNLPNDFVTLHSCLFYTASMDQLLLEDLPFICMSMHSCIYLQKFIIYIDRTPAEIIVTRRDAAEPLLQLKGSFRFYVMSADGRYLVVSSQLAGY
jgi:hypothetical protein